MDDLFKVTAKKIDTETADIQKEFKGLKQDFEGLSKEVLGVKDPDTSEQKKVASPEQVSEDSES